MRNSATLVVTLMLCGLAIGGCDSNDDANAIDSLAATTIATSAPSTTVPDWIVQAGRVVVTHTRGVDQALFEEGGVSIVSITDSTGREVAAAKAREPRYEEPVTLLAVSLPPGNYTAWNFLRSCETECRLGLGRSDAGCSESFEVVQDVTVTVDYTYFAGQSLICEIQTGETVWWPG